MESMFVFCFVSFLIDSDIQVLWRLRNMIIFDMPGVLFISKAGLLSFLLHTLHYKFLYGKGISSVTYNTLLVQMKAISVHIHH